MIRERNVIVGLVMIVLLTASPLSASVEVSGVRFSPSYGDETIALELKGAGLMKYMGFVKVYAGALYLPEAVPARQALADVPKRLEVEYFRSFKGEDFGPATIKGLRDNVTSEMYEEIESRVLYHNSLYEDIQPGDRYSLTYIPGKGTLLALNGEPKGTIEGADFAAAIFSIWLGESPFDSRFKDALLGSSQ